MKPHISITCDKIKTDHLLNWYNSRKKWKVVVHNHSDRDLYISWSEDFLDPFEGILWISKIDESSGSCKKFIAEPENVSCTSFMTEGSDERRIAPHKFVQLGIRAGQTGSWMMERQSRKDLWEGFSIYDQNMATTLKELQQEPTPVEHIMPKIKGWFWE